MDQRGGKEKPVNIIIMYIKIINCCSVGYRFKCLWSLFPLDVILLLFKCFQELLVPSCMTCSTHCSSSPLFPSTAPCILLVVHLCSSLKKYLKLDSYYLYTKKPHKIQLRKKDSILKKSVCLG